MRRRRSRSRRPCWRRSPQTSTPHLTEFTTEHILQPDYDYGDEFEFGLGPDPRRPGEDPRRGLTADAQLLGRLLVEGETAHHANGIGDDNRLEDLEMRTPSRPSGIRVSDGITWGRSIYDGSVDLSSSAKDPQGLPGLPWGVDESDARATGQAGITRAARSHHWSHLKHRSSALGSMRIISPKPTGGWQCADVAERRRKAREAAGTSRASGA